MTHRDEGNEAGLWLDPEQDCVWRAGERIALRAREIALIRYLAARPGQVVTKQELLQEVWANRLVTPGVLRVQIRAARKALGDDATRPRYIETVGSGGYRWIAPLRTDAPQEPAARSRLHSSPLSPAPSSSISEAPLELIGRNMELAFLHTNLTHVQHGQQHIVFITGEAGIGKTALVETFVSQIGQRNTLRIGRGQCLEHYGEGEAYLPLLDALTSLVQQSDGKTVLEALPRCAPTWLAQLPGVIETQERFSLVRQTEGMPQQRLLRELGAAFEALSTHTSLVLVLEDLHWSDPSTLDVIAYLAQQKTERLFVLATYRPTELLSPQHPLTAAKHEIERTGHCEDLALVLLTKPEVEQFLRQRLGGQVTTELSQLVYERTEDNPLFLVNMVEHLLAQEQVTATPRGWQLCLPEGRDSDLMPGGLRQFIDKQIASLSPGQRQVLEGASVVGMTFTTVAAAASLGLHVEQVEAVCETLADQDLFITAQGIQEWSDGTVSSAFTFQHALYQEALYRQLSATRRARFHLAIGERQERGYGGQAGERSAFLATHFERGRNYRKAIQYRHQAGEQAAQRSAHREAEHLSRAQELRQRFPTTPDRLRLSFRAWALWYQGYPDQARHDLAAVRAFAQNLSHAFNLSLALYYSSVLHQYLQEAERVQEFAEGAIKIYQEQEFLFYEPYTQVSYGWALVEQGQDEQGVARLQQGLSSIPSRNGKPFCLGQLAQAYSKVGQREAGLQTVEEALAIVQETGEAVTESDLYRLKGELLLLNDERGMMNDEWGTQHAAEAEVYFHTALEVARRQEAKMFELRAAVRLSRLWQSQDKAPAADTLLSEIYSWFTEGFDTKYLQEAHALLKELKG